MIIHINNMYKEYMNIIIYITKYMIMYINIMYKQYIIYTNIINMMQCINIIRINGDHIYII